MTWFLLSAKGPGVIWDFIQAFKLSGPARSQAIANAVVALWLLLNPLLPQRTSEPRIKFLVNKYLPLIAAEFTPQDSSSHE